MMNSHAGMVKLVSHKEKKATYSEGKAMDQKHGKGKWQGIYPQEGTIDSPKDGPG